MNRIVEQFIESGAIIEYGHWQECRSRLGRPSGKHSVPYYKLPESEREAYRKRARGYIPLLGRVIEELEQEKEREIFFIESTYRHIALVQRAAYRIAEAHPEFNSLMDICQQHDISKFSEPERAAYIELLRNRRTDSVVLEIHAKANSHHPEYWSRGTDVTGMPAICIAEMVADWQATEGDARQLFNRIRNKRWHFSLEQEALIDKLLSTFEGGD